MTSPLSSSAQPLASHRFQPNRPGTRCILWAAAESRPELDAHATVRREITTDVDSLDRWGFPRNKRTQQRADPRIRRSTYNRLHVVELCPRKQGCEESVVIHGSCADTVSSGGIRQSVRGPRIPLEAQWTRWTIGAWSDRAARFIPVTRPRRGTC